MRRVQTVRALVPIGEVCTLFKDPVKRPWPGPWLQNGLFSILNGIQVP